MTSSEGFDSWFFRSTSKDLVQTDIDRMKGLRVSFKWKDQGSDDHLKCKVTVKVMNGTDEVFRIEDWNVTPHIKEKILTS